MKISHADISRVLKAAASAGLTPIELRLSANGDVRVFFQETAAQGIPEAERDVREELAEHFATPRF